MMKELNQNYDMFEKKDSYFEPNNMKPSENNKTVNITETLYTMQNAKSPRPASVDSPY